MKIAPPPALVASPVSSVAGHSVELPCDARPSIKGDQVFSLPISTKYQAQVGKYKKRPGTFLGKIGPNTRKNSQVQSVKHTNKSGTVLLLKHVLDQVPVLKQSPTISDIHIIIIRKV